MSKNNIIKIALFVVFAFVGDRLCGEVMERLFLKSKFRYAQLYNGELPGNIVVLGDSRGLHMFHPPSIEEETGKSVANIAFNGNPTEVLPVLWQDYLANHEPPKVLILEVSCCSVEDEPGSLERFSVLVDQNSRFNELIFKRQPSNGWGNRISRLFRYNSTMMWRSLLFLRNSDQSWIMDSTLNDAMLEELINETDNKLLKIPEYVDALKEVIERADEAGVKVQLILAPFHPAFYERLEAPEDWRRWLETELEREIPDRTQLLTDPQFFGDHLHLNEQGARELARKLNAEGFFDLE